MYCPCMFKTLSLSGPGVSLQMIILCSSRVENTIRPVKEKCKSVRLPSRKRYVGSLQQIPSKIMQSATRSMSGGSYFGSGSGSVNPMRRQFLLAGWWSRLSANDDTFGGERGRRNPPHKTLPWDSEHRSSRARTHPASFGVVKKTRSFRSASSSKQLLRSPSIKTFTNDVCR